MQRAMLMRRGAHQGGRPPRSAFPRSSRPACSGGTRRATASISARSGSGASRRVHDMTESQARRRAYRRGVRSRYAPPRRRPASLVDDVYAKATGKAYSGTRGYADHRELLANKRYRRGADLHARSPACPAGHRRGAGGQGRLSAEAGLADHRRGRRHGRCGQAVGPHPPDRIAAARHGPLAAIPPRLRTGAQRPRSAS